MAKCQPPRYDSAMSGENGTALVGGKAGDLLPQGGMTPGSRRVGLDLLHFLEMIEARGQAPTDEEMGECKAAAKMLMDSKKTRTKAVGVRLMALLREIGTRRGLGVISAAKEDAPATIIERTVIFGGDWCQTLRESPKLNGTAHANGVSAEGAGD